MSLYSWRCIVDGPGDAPWHMAVDEALALAAAEPGARPTVRFYHWSRPAVTIGYFQNFSREINAGFCHRHGIDVVRRLTGGRAIVHGPDELTYSFTAPRDGPFRGADLHETYRLLSEAMVDGLRRLGIPAVFSDGRHTVGRPHRNPVCFQSLSFGEAAVEGRKVIGSAQKRWSGRFLQQGSIPLSMDTELLYSALTFSSDRLREHARRRAGNRMAGLRDFREHLRRDDLVRALREGFMARFDASMEDVALTTGETKRARALVRNRYGTPAWNRRR